MRRAAVIGAGSWGTAVAVLLARGGLEVQLGTRTAAQAAEMARRGENRRYLEGVAPARLRSRSSSLRDRARRARPRLPRRAVEVAAAGGRVDRRPDRRAVGDPAAQQGPGRPRRASCPPSTSASACRARALACLGGPAHAKEAVSGSAALVLGSADADLRTQLGEVFDSAGLVCERSDDVIGVEMAGAAKNAAALAAAAAEPHGLNAAGIAAAEIWRECVDYAIARGGKLETFTGLAGVGDLTATVLAPGSRNRRAGELLGQRRWRRRADPEMIGQASEGLDSVPLIAETIDAGRDRRRRADGPRGADPRASWAPRPGSPACAERSVRDSGAERRASRLDG